MINWNQLIAYIQIAISGLMLGIALRYAVDRRKVKKNFSKLKKIELEKWRHGTFFILSLIVLIVSLIGYYLQHQRLDLLASIYFALLCPMNLLAYIMSRQELKKELATQQGN